MPMLCPRQVDVIGPSMDIGFRISKFASDRKFVVSVEIARILSENANNHLSIYVDGVEELKGVLNGIAYPIIWIDMNNGNPTNIEKLLNKVPVKDLAILKAFLNEYIDDKKHLRFSCSSCLGIFEEDEYKKELTDALSGYKIEPEYDIPCETTECILEEEQVMVFVDQLKS